MLQVIATDVRCDRKARRYRNGQHRHFGQARALTAEDSTHRSIAIDTIASESIYLFHRIYHFRLSKGRNAVRDTLRCAYTKLCLSLFHDNRWPSDSGEVAIGLGTLWTIVFSWRRKPNTQHSFKICSAHLCDGT